jgi:hypothetical protein
MFGCDAHFRLQRIDDDLDRIYAAGMMLEGRPAKWFGTYLCKISPKEAARHQVKYVDCMICGGGGRVGSVSYP